MENSEFINKLLIAKENIGDILLLIDRMVYLEKIEKKYIKLQETNSKLQERNKKLEKQKPEEFSRILREFNDLKIKNENQYNRLKRLELTIKDIPGYKMEDKQNYLEFFVENIIPWLERSSEAKALKVIRKWFYNFENREKEGKERLGKYYVYTHRILGEEYPL